MTHATASADAPPNKARARARERATGAGLLHLDGYHWRRGERVGLLGVIRSPLVVGLPCVVRPPLVVGLLRRLHGQRVCLAVPAVRVGALLGASSSFGSYPSGDIELTMDRTRVLGERPHGQRPLKSFLLVVDVRQMSCLTCANRLCCVMDAERVDPRDTNPPLRLAGARPGETAARGSTERGAFLREGS